MKVNQLIFYKKKHPMNTNNIGFGVNGHFWGVLGCSMRKENIFTF